MLFLFGTRSSKLGEYPLPGIRCVNCATPDSVAVTVFSRYFHVFWLPLFPVSKRAVSGCAHCQQALETRQWPPAYQPLGWRAQQQAKVPLTHYLGLLLLGVPLLLLLGIGLVASVKDGFSGTHRPPAAAPGPSGNEALLAAPQPGDLYAMRNADNGHFGLMQVTRVGADTVYLRTSTYYPTTLAAVRAHPDSVRRGLSSFTVPMPRTNVAAMNRTGLLTVLR